MHFRNRSDHELGYPSNERKDNIFLIDIGGGDVYGSSGEFLIRGETTPCVQNQENFVWTRAIVEGVVPPYRLVFINEALLRAKRIIHYLSNEWMLICWWHSSTLTI